VIGVSKAGKTTLLNNLIGKIILDTKETIATNTMWSVEFHKENNYKLRPFG
jgi:GTPase SAR1 family protein